MYSKVVTTKYKIVLYEKHNSNFLSDFGIG